MMPTANIAKFPILKEQKTLPSRYFLQPCDRFLGPIVYDISVGFENADMVANLLCDTQQVIGRVDIGRDAEVGALYRDQAEEVGS